jgi:hypothetical protein
MGYVPPQLRDKINYKPKNLTRKAPVIDYTNLKSRRQLFEEYSNENYGKSDTAWTETSYKNIIHYDNNE